VEKKLLNKKSYNAILQSEKKAYCGIILGVKAQETQLKE